MARRSKPAGPDNVRLADVFIHSTRAHASRQGRLALGQLIAPRIEQITAEAMVSILS